MSNKVKQKGKREMIKIKLGSNRLKTKITVELSIK